MSAAHSSTVAPSPSMMIVTTRRNTFEGLIEVAVNDALLVGVLNAVADPEKQLEALAQAEPVAVAMLGDGHARALARSPEAYGAT